MNPANNPQGGAAKNGPTACLNSLAKFNAKYHGGGQCPKHEIHT